MNLLFRIGYRAAYRAAAGMVAAAPAACATGRRWRSGRATRCSWCARPTGPQLDLPGGGIESGRDAAWPRRSASCAKRPASSASRTELVDAGRVPFRGQPSQDHRVTVRVAAGLVRSTRSPTSVRSSGPGSCPRPARRDATRQRCRASIWTLLGASGAERHPPDLARIVADRPVAREPAHVRGVEHGLGPPRGRVGVGALDPALGMRRRRRNRPSPGNGRSWRRSSSSGRKRPGSSGEKWPVSISSKARARRGLASIAGARREAAPAGVRATSSAVRPKMKMLSGPTCSQHLDVGAVQRADGQRAVERRTSCCRCPTPPCRRC